MLVEVSETYLLRHWDGGGCVCSGCATAWQSLGSKDRDRDAAGSGGACGPSGARDGPSAAWQQASGGAYTYGPASGGLEQGVNALTERVWDRTDLTYSFPDAASDYEPNYLDGAALASLSAFTGIQKTVARQTFDAIAAVSGLRFTELTGSETGDADLRLARSNTPSTAYTYMPHDDPVGGDSFFNTYRYGAPQPGNYDHVTFGHEIAHGLGLKHGHETDGGGAIPYAYDSMEFSIMTYRSWVGKPLDYGYANETWGYAQSLMMLDVAALQRMYGANYDTNAGDTRYRLSPDTGELTVDGSATGTPGGNRVFRTIWDGGGVDTYDFTAYRTDLAVDLAPGGWTDLDVGGTAQRAMLEFGYNGNPVTFARGHLFNAMLHDGDPRSLIENARGGTGNDSFRGNDADNRFEGRAGDDFFFDSPGADVYFGGIGTDTVSFGGEIGAYVLQLADTVIEVIGEAVDRVAESVEWLVFGGESFSRDGVLALIDPGPGVEASGDAFALDEDDSLSGSVTANDTVPAGATATLVEGAAHGTLDFAPDGAFTYTPDGDYFGPDGFRYALDNGTSVATAEVLLTVRAVNDAPVALADAASVVAGQTVVIDVLADDMDVDGDTLSIADAGGALLGTVEIDAAAGILRYTAGAAAGTDLLTYVASDGTAESAPATLTVTVEPAPVAGPTPAPGVSLSGTPAKEDFVGTDGDDTIDGGGGGDTILGRGGADLLDGDGGWDVIDGGAGDDRIDGGRNPDTLTGGEGADVFVFGQRTGSDLVTDFEPGVDALSFSGPVTAVETVEGLSLQLDSSNYVVLAGLTLADLPDIDIL